MPRPRHSWTIAAWDASRDSTAVEVNDPSASQATAPGETRHDVFGGIEESISVAPELQTTLSISAGTDRFVSYGHGTGSLGMIETRWRSRWF